MRLKSCAAPSGTTLRPSAEREQRDLAPSSSSSITTLAAERAAAAQRRRRPPPACGRRRRPCPRPGRRPSRRRAAGDGERRCGRNAGGEHDVLARTSSTPRSAPPPALGPKTAMPLRRSSSAMPATSGASGPITTRSASSGRGEAEQAVGVVGSDRVAVRRGRRCPGLPGAACSSVRRGLCASRHARACSRAPEPTSRTFTGRVYVGVRSKLRQGQRLPVRSRHEDGAECHEPGRRRPDPGR